MKVFISADIEGTCGIAHWDETEYGKPDYEYFRRQMTREVAAACQGAVSAGFGDILIKDAHDGGRNIIPQELPLQARIFRSSARHPLIMMAGLTEAFDGVVFTGYHSAAGTSANPLAHTMNGRNNYIKINGEFASELMLNALSAAMLGVPVYCVTGDKGLCGWIQSVNSNIAAVPVSEGHGSGSISIHPDLAVARIKAAVQEALQQPRAACMFPFPERFEVEINFKQHADAMNASWYPGCTQLDAKTVRFEAENYWDVLLFVYWVL